MNRLEPQEEEEGKDRLTDAVVSTDEPLTELAGQWAWVPFQNSQLTTARASPITLRATTWPVDTAQLQCELTQARNRNAALEARVNELAQLAEYHQRKGQHFEVLYNEMTAEKERLAKILGTYREEIGRLQARITKG